MKALKYPAQMISLIPTCLVISQSSLLGSGCRLRTLLLSVSPHNSNLMFWCSP